MATMILLPDDTGVASAKWVAVGETYRHQCLDDDNGATSYVRTNQDGVSMIIEFANPDDVTSVNSGVAEAGIDFNETVSVRFLSSGKSSHRTNPSLVDISFALLIPESCSYNAHRTNFETIKGTARTTHDGINPWTYATLEALEILCTKDGTIEVLLSYLALEVTYTEAAAGYGNNVLGVASANISKINGIATADISKVNGV